MAETLFTFLLAAAALALVTGARRASWRLYALGGALLALATMTRAAAELLLPVVPLVAALLSHRRSRLAASPVGRDAGRLRWSSRCPGWPLTWVQAGSLGASGLGEALFWRGTRERPPEARSTGRSAAPRTWPTRPAPRPAASPTTASSKTSYRATSRCCSSSASATARPRPTASCATSPIELFARQPGLYVQTSLGAVRRAAGRHASSTSAARARPAACRRYPNPQDKYGDWWNERVRHLALAGLASRGERVPPGPGRRQRLPAVPLRPAAARAARHRAGRGDGRAGLAAGLAAGRARALAAAD